MLIALVRFALEKISSPVVFGPGQLALGLNFGRPVLCCLLSAWAFGCRYNDGETAVLSGPAADGQRLFLAYDCSSCHGLNGRGDGPVANSLNPKPRDLSDSRAYKRGASLAQIEETIEKGLFISESVMPAYPQIPASERACIAQYIQTLQRK